MTTLSDKMHDALLDGQRTALDTLRDVVSTAIEEAYREGYEAACKECEFSPSISLVNTEWNQSEARANLWY